MRFLKTFSIVLVAIAVLLYGLFFLLQNDSPVPLNLLVVELSPQRVSLWLVAAFITGALVGFALCAVALANEKVKKRSAQKKLAAKENQLQKFSVSGQSPGQST